jgi:Cu2+-exporting ATPase
VLVVLKLSRATYGKMIQNLIWATGYNVVAIPLAAGVAAAWSFFLSPAIGALFMSLSTIIVSINAMLLRRVKLARNQPVTTTQGQIR